MWLISCVTRPHGRTKLNLLPRIGFQPPPAVYPPVDNMPLVHQIRVLWVLVSRNRTRLNHLWSQHCVSGTDGNLIVVHRHECRWIRRTSDHKDHDDRRATRPGQSGGYAVFISDITFIRGYQREAWGANPRSTLGPGFAAKGGRRARSSASVVFSQTAC